jgi:hypothetical protein
LGYIDSFVVKETEFVGSEPVGNVSASVVGKHGPNEGEQAAEGAPQKRIFNLAPTIQKS